MPKSIAAVAMLALLGAAPVADTPLKTGLGTPYYAGPPPARFIKEGFVPVLFVNPNNINAACGIEDPPGLTLMACARMLKSGVKIVIMPHPAAVMHLDPYAMLLAHELSHAIGGWPGDHPA